MVYPIDKIVNIFYQCQEVLLYPLCKFEFMSPYHDGIVNHIETVGLHII